MQRARRVHLDTDIGDNVDDLCALALVLRWRGVEVTGVTTVADPDGWRADLARRVLVEAGRPEVPVAGNGAAALDLLARSALQGARVVGIGPYSGLAGLEAQSPGLLRRAGVVLMGGSVRPAPPGFPPRDYRSDTNVQADVEASHVVLHAADPVLVPLEVTVQTALRAAHLPILRRAGPLGNLVADEAERYAARARTAERYAATCPAVPDDLLAFLHDPLAVAVALDWPGAMIKTLRLAVETHEGQLRLRPDPHGLPLRVVTAVDRAAFERLWLETVASATT